MWVQVTKPTTVNMQDSGYVMYVSVAKLVTVGIQDSGQLMRVWVAKSATVNPALLNANGKKTDSRLSLAI